MLIEFLKVEGRQTDRQTDRHTHFGDTMRDQLQDLNNDIHVTRTSGSKILDFPDATQQILEAMKSSSDEELDYS